jgi:hypothetical protein
VVRLRKPHPCGGTDWRVTRLGADIGLNCLTCGRRVLLERPVLEKRLKQFVSRGISGAPEKVDLPEPDPARPEALEGRGAARLHAPSGATAPGQDTPSHD